MHVGRGKAFLEILLLVLGVLVQTAASAPRTPLQSAWQALPGTWSLPRTDAAGAHGPVPDPLFGANSQRPIIYDRAGWTSVQIVAIDRPSMDAVQSRAPDPVAPDEAQRRARACNSFYAYFGHWEFDDRMATVTHHIEASPRPLEAGLV